MNLRSPCPIAAALDIVGDRWTLLIVRDMLFFDRHRFGEFMEAGESITTNILTDRLRRLETYGLVRKTAYQQRPVRYAYSLTEKGKTLQPVVAAMIDWGSLQVEGTGRLDPQPKPIN